MLWSLDPKTVLEPEAEGFGGQVGEQDGIHYLVMEYIEGETLAFYVREQEMWAATIETDPEFRVGTPRLLFEGPYDFGSPPPPL